LFLNFNHPYLRSTTALFFSFLFAIVLAAPTVISLVDEAQEVGVFIDLSEEEENKEGTESSIDAELKLFTTTQNDFSKLNKIQENKNIRFQSKYYFLEHSKIDTPPPKKLLFS
jgi:hypothetical protein